MDEELRSEGLAREVINRVQKLRKIYKSFEQVGIKDRSMIWNSYVPGLLQSISAVTDVIAIKQRPCRDS